MRVLTQRLRRAMHERGFERADLAERMHSSYRVVNSWFTGERTPQAGTIVELCKVLDVSADYLLGLKEEMK